MNPVVAVLDLGAGDFSEFIDALETAGSKVVITSQRSEILDADAFVVYGAGQLSSLMSALDLSLIHI